MNLSVNSFKTTDFDEENTQLWATLVICLLIAGIGVPVWWKTTEVYRAVLPFEEISQLEHDKNLALHISLEFLNLNLTFDINSLTEDVLKYLRKDEFNAPLQFNYQAIVKHLPSSIQHDPYSMKVDNSNVVKIIFVQQRSMDSQNIHIKVTSGRIVWCEIPKEIIPNDIAKSVSSIIQDTLVNEGILTEMVSKHHHAKNKFLHDDAFMKMVQTNPKFELLFSLLCPEPESVLPEWDIQQALQAYFQPVLETLNPIFDFHVGSQILYYTKIMHKAKMQKNNKNEKYFTLTRDQLSHVINPIEGRLGSQLSSDPTLNFAVYVVEKKYTPLYIKKQDSSLSRTNALLVPRWGSLVFYNIPPVNTSQENDMHNIRIQMKAVMEPFFSHFRILLGLQNDIYHISVKDIVYDKPTIKGITDWEFDYLMRLRSLENVAVTIHTLTSLSKLLNQIKNIVINDNIAKDLYKAVSAVTKAKHYLSKGNLTEGFKYSKIAFTASETAFFDPTLLELLYFPEDQKFAIYVPLFLPISLPIALSLLYAIKRIKSNKKLKEE